MKLKYYLRGIGVGILFTTIVMAVSFKGYSKNKLTDEEIIKKAEELGMVKQEENSLDLEELLKPSTTPSISPSVSTVDQNETTTEKEEETDDTATDDSDSTTEITPTQKPAVTPFVTPSEKPIKEDDKKSEVKETQTAADGKEADGAVTIEINVGMSSKEVSRMLKEKGIIEDSNAFNQYLQQNDYTTYINVGKYQIKPYSSYADIADIIVKK